MVRPHQIQVLPHAGQCIGVVNVLLGLQAHLVGCVAIDFVGGKTAVSQCLHGGIGSGGVGEGHQHVIHRLEDTEGRGMGVHGHERNSFGDGQKLRMTLADTHAGPHQAKRRCAIAQTSLRPAAKVLS